MIYKIILSVILYASANLLLGNTISINSYADEPLEFDDSSCTVSGAPPIA